MCKKILNEILLSHKPSEGIYKLLETGQINEIIPELVKLKGFDQKTPYHDKDVLDHTMAVVDSTEPRLTLRMAALLHDISKPDCFTVDEKCRGHFYGHHIKSAEESEKILKRLGYDDDFIEDVCILIRYHYIKDISSSIREKGIDKFIESVGEHRIDDMLKLVVADMMGKPDNTGNMEVVNKLRELIEQHKQNRR